MATHKVQRATEDVKRELTDIVRNMKDPRLSGGLITIVRIELSGDMSHCKVYVSAVDGIEAAKAAIKGLESGAGFIRREINLRLKLRRSPEFKFIPDDSIQHSADIAQTLTKLVGTAQPQQDEE